MVFQNPSEWNIDMDDDEEDNVALHLGLVTKWSWLQKFEDKNDRVCSLRMKLSFHR
jgi:hypothetical protein